MSRPLVLRAPYSFGPLKKDPVKLPQPAAETQMARLITYKNCGSLLGRTSGYHLHLRALSRSLSVYGNTMRREMAARDVCTQTNFSGRWICEQ